MSATVFWGIFTVGFIFGYLLFYAVRHTSSFSVDMLGVAIGAIGGATIIGFLGNHADWIGPYGLGLGAGFMFYFILSIILIATGAFEKLSNVGILAKSLLGTPRE